MAAEKTPDKTTAKHAERPPKDASTKDALIAAGSRVFSEKGYEGATVKDLADEAGVNVSLVSYHFGGKEGLYRACLENFGKFRLETAERLLRKPESEADFRLRLTMFAEEFMNANICDMDICKIIHRDLDMGENPIAMDVFKTTFLPVFFAFRDFFVHAQQVKIIRSDFDALNAAAMLFGSLIHSVTSEPLRKKTIGQSLEDPAYLQKTIHDYISIFVDGCLRKQGT
ncbi:MAG: TetR family transcriptional regulator [Bdellovibrionaceae bacterium]|nr:TetR family transcriptional regulator [Pseudobdellovibrionaceae bacterium]